MFNTHTANVCLAAPGLAISGTTTKVKYANTFTYRASGRLSGTVTTADAPALSTAKLVAPYPNGTASTAGVLATGYYRVYTLVATLPVNGTNSITPTYSWLASSDILASTDVVNMDVALAPDQPNQTVIGWVIANNASGSNFTPDSTAMSSITCTYIDNYGVMGR